LTSRGFRLAHLQMERIYDLTSEVHANANQVVKCLIDLGLNVWARLSQGQRRQVLKQTSLRYFDARIKRKLELTQKEVELNDRLGFALPSGTKRSIKRLANRTHTTMSEVAREKLRS